MRWYNLTCATLLSSLSLLTINSKHCYLNKEEQAIEQVDNLYVIGDSLSDNGALVGAGTHNFLKVIKSFQKFKKLKWKNLIIIINFVMVQMQLVL